MRVLLSAYACQPHHGSEPALGWGWATALARHGHDVEVLSHPMHRAAVEQELCRLPGPVPRFHFLTPQRWSRLPQPRARLYAEYLAWRRQAERHALTLGRFDVVHHVTWASLVWGTRLGSLGFPLVVGPVGGGQTASSRHSGEFGASWRQEQVRSLVVHRVLPALPDSRRLRAARHVLATNSATTAWLRRVGVRDVSTMLADGVDASFLRSELREPNPDPVFLWAGRLMPLKAAPLAVRAFARVRAQLPTARLLIAGHGSEQDAVAALVTALGLDGSVELLGPLPWPEVRELMDAADCFVFSSLRDSFGGQCLEAAARGLPLAVFNHHGAGELLPDAATRKARVDVPDLAGELAEAMLEVVADPVCWRAMSRAAVEWAAQQTWDAKASAIAPIYARVRDRKH
jgi:glycosyltransferase involved in cell wall biosynthesis